MLTSRWLVILVIRRPNIEVAGLHNLEASPESGVDGLNGEVFCPNFELLVQLVR